MEHGSVNTNNGKHQEAATASFRQSLGFLLRFLQSPQSVGSVIPSSPALIQALLDAIDWPVTQSIVELGGGTGAITAKIDQLRSPESRFWCFENNPGMQRDLAKRFSGITVEGDAFSIRETLSGHRCASLDCVVCGLPLVNFPKLKRERLLTEVHDLLKPGGIFLAFQYTRRLRPALVTTFDELDSRYVWNNLPPAYVFTCRKREML